MNGAPEIRGICSMATSGLLQALASTYTQRAGARLRFEAVGGVEAARRVAAGEPFDVVVLASDAIDKLAAAGHLDGAQRMDFVRSGVGVAVPAGAVRPDIATEQAVRHAVLKAARVAYSTGPSGVALVAQFERWGVLGELQGRLVQAPPGVPVGSLLARREADLGFQQMSELVGVEGIELIGPLPESIQVITTFCATPGAGAARSDAARAVLRFLASNECDDAVRRHGMARP
jgi:molybdate transport system substrate-binding protein